MDKAFREVKAHFDCKCTRCGHEWETIRLERPRICPKCKSAYWDVARKVRADG
jgi:predicted Zn-ribbon and HTH transcriptional regulator